MAYLRRDGGGAPIMAEWFVNRQNGLEHGFTVTAPPDGRRGGALVLELAVTGGLVAQLGGGWGADAVSLRTTRGERVLSCSGLLVHDASGRAVPGTLLCMDAGSAAAGNDSGPAADAAAGKEQPMTAAVASSAAVRRRMARWRCFCWSSWGFA